MPLALPFKINVPKTETPLNLKSASFIVIMLCNYALTLWVQQLHITRLTWDGGGWLKMFPPFLEKYIPFRTRLHTIFPLLHSTQYFCNNISCFDDFSPWIYPVFVSFLFQEKLLGLMSLPTKEKYEELKEKRKEEQEKRLQQERLVRFNQSILICIADSQQKLSHGTIQLEQD